MRKFMEFEFSLPFDSSFIFPIHLGTLVPTWSIWTSEPQPRKNWDKRKKDSRGSHKEWKEWGICYADGVEQRIILAVEMPEVERTRADK